MLGVRISLGAPSFHKKIMSRIKYTKEMLEPLVKESKSFTEVVRKLSVKPTGGNVTHMKKIITRFGIDWSHMTGQAHGKNKKSNNWSDHTDKLVMLTPQHNRIQASKLRTALDTIGREYKCVTCGNEGFWNGKPLRLEIDHKDNCYWNNTPDNLQYLCPNCHAMKPD